MARTVSSQRVEFSLALRWLLAALLCASSLPEHSMAALYTWWHPISIRDHFSRLDAVVMARRIPGLGPSTKTIPRYEVVRILKVFPGARLDEGHRIAMSGWNIPRDGLVLVSGTRQADASVAWEHIDEITEASVGFIIRLSRLTPEKTLVDCLKLIECPDHVISSEVYEVLSNSTVQELVAVKQLIPRDQLRALFIDPMTEPRRQRLYARLLALSEDKASEKLLQQKAFDIGDVNDLPLEVMFAYLYLTRERGLDTLQRRIITNPRASFNEGYVALTAIGIMWHEAPSRIAADRLRQAIRPLLKREDLTDFVIPHLTRMSDWSVQDKLIAMHGQADEYPYPDVLRKAIVEYVKASKTDVPAGIADAATRVKQAEEFLKAVGVDGPR